MMTKKWWLLNGWIGFLWECGNNLAQTCKDENASPTRWCDRR
ncbi:MAG TPA: hypothetical protein V6D33_19140 [Cyanophyceae cyanobacterium]